MGKGLAALQKALKEIETKQVKVGFFETSHYTDGTPVAYVAAIQEFGHGPIPPRPFMRPAEAENKSKWAAGIAQGVKRALAGGGSVVDALDQVGRVAAGDVRKAIQAVTTPALKEATVNARKARLSKRSRKKANPVTIRKPLVDTGELIRSVDSAVVDK